MIKLPILVTGVAGVAGYNAFFYFQRKYPGQVIGIRQEDNWRLESEGIIPCDIENEAKLKNLFAKYKFQTVLNAAGNCALKACELDPALAHRVNVEGIRNLLSITVDQDIRLVHLSIDLVFSGEKCGGYLEEDEKDPVTVYGKTMDIAERLILTTDPRIAMLRISLPMGISFNGHAGAIDWIQSRFAKSKPATLYYDEIRTPTYVDCMNRLYEVMLSNQLSGIYNAAGPRKLSLYQIAQVINRVGGYDPDLLMGCYRLEAGPIPPRAGNVAMDPSKLINDLGYNPFDHWPNSSEFVPTHRKWHSERNNGITGSPELLSEILYRNPTYSDPLPVLDSK